MADKECGGIHPGERYLEWSSMNPEKMAKWVLMKMQ
jgi:hypothetical protein